MTDQQRKERAIWKLEQAGYRVEHQGSGYRLISAEQIDLTFDLAQLAAFADAVYERVWTNRRITPSA
jgi:hypothetical protein